VIALALLLNHINACVTGVSIPFFVRHFLGLNGDDGSRG